MGKNREELIHGLTAEQALMLLANQAFVRLCSRRLAQSASFFDPESQAVDSNKTT